jgi:preprotein translocase subunit SecD
MVIRPSSLFVVNPKLGKSRCRLVIFSQLFAIAAVAIITSDEFEGATV